jgi:hypothetical protein
MDAILRAMKKYILLAACGTLFAASAHAEVKSQSDSGFVIGHTTDVLAKPDEVWKRLIVPKDWWNPAHSWSGKTDGFYIDAQAGGCFCELLQDKAADGKVKPRGSVEHMRVLFTDPGKVLRMTGALGPLQSEAMHGTLTIAMEPLKDGGGTKISLSYVVGGYMRYKVADIAPAVDAMLGDQFQRLTKPMGKVVAGSAKAGEWKIDPEKLEGNSIEDRPKTEIKADADKPKVGKPVAKEVDKAVNPK